MGLIFGGSTTENEDAIEKLEDEISDLKHTARQARTKARAAKKRAQEAEQNAIEEAENAAQLAHALNNLHMEDAAELDYKSGVVETLDEARIAWKATDDHVVKLLLPEGTTVVHPEGMSTKKRGDEAIPLAFYDAEENIEHQRTMFGADKEYRTKDVGEEPTTTIEDHSIRNEYFDYEIGESATPDDDLNTNVEVECRSGIHFFPTKEGALDWYQA